MASVPSVAALRALSVSAFASPALSAASLVFCEIDSRLALVSAMEPACSDAPPATAWLVAAICAEAEEICSTAVTTPERTAASFSEVALKLSRSGRVFSER